MFSSLRARVLVLVGGTMIATAGSATLLRHQQEVASVRERAEAEIEILASLLAKDLGRLGIGDEAALDHRVTDLLQQQAKIRSLAVYRPDGSAVAAHSRDGRHPPRLSSVLTIPSSIGLTRTELVRDSEGRSCLATVTPIPAPYVSEVIGSFELVYHLADYDRLITLAQVQALQSLGILVILSVMLSLAIARWVTQPLHQLRTAMDAVSAGDLNVRLDTNPPREFRHIFDSFNFMAAELENVRGELTELNCSLQRQVESRTRDLMSAKDRAEVANRAKSGFLANMSHEIRTPLTAILGYTEAVLDEDRDQPLDTHTLDSIQTVHDNSEHLLQLINDILDLSRIESGKLEAESVPCSPRRILKDVALLLGKRAEQKGLQLRMRARGAIPEAIRSDPMRIRQILLNLMGNAIKFTDTGHVTVETSLVQGLDGPMLQLDVMDSGVGIRPEAVHKLFKPFSQADSTMARRYGGSGLGLAICRRLAGLIGGEVGLLWSAPNRGSAFRAIIPTGPLESVRLLDDLPAPPETEAASASDPVTAPAPEPKPKKAPGKRDKSMQLLCRILLAEDGRDNQRLIKLMLERAGAQVVVVENGQAAVDTLEASRDDRAFDVVLMDMQMPVLDGYSATTELRRRGFDLPVIALTAHAMTGDRERCLEAGCTDYATKPIRWADLITSIMKHHSSGSPANAS